MAEGPVTHISQSGIIEDDDGFFLMECRCGLVLGPFPDPEDVLDMAMEHAWRSARIES